MNLKQTDWITNNTIEFEADFVTALANIYKEFEDEEMLFTVDIYQFYVRMVIDVSEVGIQGDGEMWFVLD